MNLPLKIKYQQKLELRIFRQELRYGYRFFGGSDFESFLGEEMNQEESFLFLKIIYALTFNKNLFLHFFFFFWLPSSLSPFVQLAFLYGITWYKTSHVS